jgi:uncharacterized membrane protein YiaA
MDINLNSDITQEKQQTARTAKRSQFKYLIKNLQAFIGASWIPFYRCYLCRVMEFDMQLNEGYYFTVLLFGLFSAISVQKKRARSTGRIRSY